jgi:hypothetical protein
MPLRGEFAFGGWRIRRLEPPVCPEALSFDVTLVAAHESWLRLAVLVGAVNPPSRPNGITTSTGGCRPACRTG